MSKPSSTVTPEATHETRRKLLLAAAQVFARLGFEHATVREICEQAGANVAAVNYHFGGKMELYRAVLLAGAEEKWKRYPDLALTDSEHGAEENLLSFVHSLLRQILETDCCDQNSHMGLIMAREMVEPTEVLEDIVNGFIRPSMEMLERLVQKLSGPGADPDAIRRATLSIIGQCLFYKHSWAVMQYLHPKVAMDEAEIRAIAEHITQFSIAGIGTLPRKKGSRRK